MANLLNIDSSIENACVSISRNGIVQSKRLNFNQKEHASFLHIAISEILNESACTFSQLDAIAVTSGPGSYTGLRVGLSTAKGFSYALNRPLITIGTLDVMAYAAIQQEVELTGKDIRICPMIDARRMEVYTAVYDRLLQTILPAAAMILDENTFSAMLDQHKMIFLGSGISKWEKIMKHANGFFIKEPELTEALAHLTFSKYQKQDFTDIAYSEPLYVKEFFSP